MTYEVFNAILYINRSGCQWDMLPHDFPAKSTVSDPRTSPSASATTAPGST